MSQSRVCLALMAVAMVLVPAAPLAAASGKFVVLPPTVTTAAMRAEARKMHDSGTLQELAKALNVIFVLPRDITLRFAECGEANAYYDPSTREISMCLELMGGMAETLEGQFEDEETTANALAGAFLAVVLHEAGHALVDVLEIPITGREEDAVDQLSAWILIEAEDVDSVRGAAATYYIDDDVGDDDFADEHSLNKQRYFNLVCWAYGSDPDNQQDLIESWELPKARAERCVDEYALLDRSWKRLLEKHLREEADTAPVTTESRPRRSPTSLGDAILGDDARSEEDTSGDDGTDADAGGASNGIGGGKKKGD